MRDLKHFLKNVWPFVRPFKRRLYVVVGSGVLMAALAPSAVYLVNRLYTAFEQKDVNASHWIPFSFPVLFLFLGFIRYIHNSSTKYAVELVISEIRAKLMDQFVHLSLSFHNSFDSGSGGLINRVLSDTNILQEGLYFSVAILREPIAIVIMIGQMFWLNWELTLFTFVAAPVFTIMMSFVRKGLRKYGHLNRAAMDKLSGTLKESLDGVRVIQSFNLEEKILKRFQINQDEYLRTRKQIIDREEAISPLNEFLGSLAVMGISIFSFHQIFGGRSTPAEFTAFLMAAGVVQPPIKNLQTALVKLQQTYVVTERLFGIIESKLRIPQIQKPKPFPKDWQRIRFVNVSFSYGSENVLKGFSLEVERGSVVALVGESGSGKSTVVNLLERFFDPSSGEIYIDDTPIRDFDLADLRRHIALVTQDVFLFNESLAENIQSGDLQKSAALVENAARAANAHNFIVNLPQTYSNLVGERGGLLSGGEKQRVSIARAIFKDAPILILDEATSALDSVSEMEVQKGLQSLMSGRTAFVIAHRLSTVFSADLIIVLKKGEIIELGTHKSLLAQSGEYSNFFRLQSSLN